MQAWGMTRGNSQLLFEYLEWASKGGQTHRQKSACKEKLKLRVVREK